MARKKTKPRPFEAVPEVTHAHAEKFVDAVFAGWTSSGAIYEAFEKSAIATWPPAPDSVPIAHLTPEQEEYQDTENRIIDEIESRIRPALVSAFLDVATRVLHAGRTRSSRPDSQAARARGAGQASIAAADRAAARITSSTAQREQSESAPRLQSRSLRK